MSYSVKVHEEFDSLPPELKEEFEGAYIFSDGGHVLVIEVNGKLDMWYTDKGEPEDNTFGRDYGWIVRELREAYAQGLSDGREGTTVE